ncbi:MAG TPA: hypothetical protein VGX23_31185 [Actinocrinis sp.]|nr:hypothetical protein [Actinocrinis sp.]
MRRTIFAAVAVAAGAGLAGMGAAGPASAAAAPACGGDGTATLCVSAAPARNSLALTVTVTQLDGPGVYSVFFTNTTTGVSSAPRAVGPLAYQASESSTLYLPTQHCRTVTLVDASGTSLTVGPVCG